MRWEPIETAPMDGTEIITYVDFATVPIVHLSWYRSKQEWESSGQYCGGWNTLEEWEGWWTYPENSVSQVKLEGYATPTHWIPMPDIPRS